MADRLAASCLACALATASCSTPHIYTQSLVAVALLCNFPDRRQCCRVGSIVAVALLRNFSDRRQCCRVGSIVAVALLRNFPDAIEAAVAARNFEKGESGVSAAAAES